MTAEAAAGFFWRCWRCGGQHPRWEDRCPNGSPDANPPTRAAMAQRLNAFLECYASACESRKDTRTARVPGRGRVPIAAAVRMEMQ
jgi:hypothetical protein